MPNPLSKLTQRKRHTILLAIFLLLCVINISLLLKFLPSQITTVNNAKLYTVDYKPTKKFTAIIDTWGLWAKNRIYYHDKEFTTVNKLKIIFTDEKQELYVEKDPNGEILWSATSTLEGEHTLVFKIQLGPSLIKNLSSRDNNRIVDKKINSIVLTSAYFLTHPTRYVYSKTLQRPYLDTFFKIFDQHPDYIPFHTRPLN